ncbi:hypothetical protein CIHG_04912 [Coccidioides immitis H538.4]|uniref:Uncharacterized protein n=2 Tax=Coccidioides immitis TaxID=5501 RepID=A0A0J8QPV8_COCIT|nr:hypothetical protein CISG_04542 [Coccidioides immitis RMSCC 3703]KMU86972.1 hypothetical protein CIHG_04912 [Coccidioides immitis H538.4]
MGSGETGLVFARPLPRFIARSSPGSQHKLSHSGSRPTRPLPLGNWLQKPYPPPAERRPPSTSSLAAFPLPAAIPPAPWSAKSHRPRFRPFRRLTNLRCRHGPYADGPLSFCFLNRGGTVKDSESERAFLSPPHR